MICCKQYCSPDAVDIGDVRFNKEQNKSIQFVSASRIDQIFPLLAVVNTTAVSPAGHIVAVGGRLY